MTSPRVLVVDDSSMALYALRSALAAVGVTPVEASSVAAARVAIAAEPFDAALLDLELGDGDGVEVAHELAARGGRCRVAFVSSGASDALLRAALEVGPLFSKCETLDDAVAWLVCPTGRP